MHVYIGVSTKANIHAKVSGIFNLTPSYKLYF